MSAMQKAMEAERAYRERIADKVLSEEGGGKTYLDDSRRV